jgi:hypothetical protein
MARGADAPGPRASLCSLHPKPSPAVARALRLTCIYQRTALRSACAEGHSDRGIARTLALAALPPSRETGKIPSAQVSSSSRVPRRAWCAHRPRADGLTATRTRCTPSGERRTRAGRQPSGARRSAGRCCHSAGTRSCPARTRSAGRQAHRMTTPPAMSGRWGCRVPACGSSSREGVHAGIRLSALAAATAPVDGVEPRPLGGEPIEVGGPIAAVLHVVVERP